MVKTSARLILLALSLGCSKANEVRATDPTGPALAQAGPAQAPAPDRAPAKPPKSQRTTPPTTDLVTMRDPVENAFTVGMPKAWKNQAYSARVASIHSTVATSVSPDGSVVIFSGDPSIPQYWSPAAATPITYQMAQNNPRMKIEPFVRATDYFPGYVQRKFGRLPGFKLLATEADPEAEGKLREKFASVGAAMEPTVANVSFSYSDGAKRMRAMVIGSTCDSGAFWIVTVSGIATTGDPKAYVPMLDAMGQSYKVNPQWQAEQNQKHQQRMAQIEQFGRDMTAQHNRNMAAIQQSAQRHQQRMQAIQAQGDASTKAFNDRMAASDTNMKAFNDRMAAGDTQQRNFLNYINEENTVVDSSGKTFQVDSSYQRYYINKNDGTYVGGDIRMDPDKLRSLGLNPDNYEEAQIKK